MARPRGAAPTGARAEGDQLIAERVIDANQQLVWQALTVPEHLAGFWGGEHAIVPVESVVVDLTPGGVFELETRGRDGGGRRLRFVYELIQEPTLLVFTEPATGILTEMHLRASWARTVVTIHQRRVPPELRSGQATSGLAGILHGLDALVRRLRHHEGRAVGQQSDETEELHVGPEIDR